MGRVEGETHVQRPWGRKVFGLFEGLKGHVTEV